MYNTSNSSNMILTIINIQSFKQETRPEFELSYNVSTFSKENSKESKEYLGGK